MKANPVARSREGGMDDVQTNNLGSHLLCPISAIYPHDSDQSSFSAPIFGTQCLPAILSFRAVWLCNPHFYNMHFKQSPCSTLPPIFVHSGFSKEKKEKNTNIYNSHIQYKSKSVSLAHSSYLV